PRRESLTFNKLWASRVSLRETDARCQKELPHPPSPRRRNGLTGRRGRRTLGASGAPFGATRSHDSRFQIPDSRIPDSRFQIPDSRKFHILESGILESGILES